MPLRPNMEPHEFLDILRRKKWVILFSVLLFLFGATVYCVLATEQYRSTVKLVIIPPTVSEGVIQSNVNLKIEDRLLMIRQDLRSSSYLMGLINEFGISTLGFKEKFQADMLETMRKRIIVDNDPRNDSKSDARKEGDSFTFNLSFDHENPQVARDVASRLASFFVVENIKSREAITKDTSKFLASQVEETRKRLEMQEERIKRYKIQFGGELPQQEGANLNRLTRLQDQIKSNSESIARLADRKVFMQAQISNLESNTRSAWNAAERNIASPNQTSSIGQLLAELAMRRKKLEDLSEKYTPLYPTVVQARNEVKLLEARIARLRQAASKGDGVPAGEVAARPPAGTIPDHQEESLGNGEIQRLRDQVAAIDMEIVASKRESASAMHTIDQIQRKMERLPQREQEIIALTRDYDNIKRSYDELLKKQLEAGISENLEGKKKGEKFQVLEPANLPTRPVKPERLMVLGLALLASLVIGAGGSIGLEMLDPTLRGSREFKSYFDIPILACLPVIQDDRSKHRVAVRRVAVVGGLVSILGAYVIFLALHGAKVLSILQTFRLSIGDKN